MLGTFPLFRKYNIWMSGAKGEEKVAKCLKSLGGRYHVFNDVALPRTHSDIDHVVVAPNGFFCCIHKNNNGKISCNGDSWNQLKTGKKAVNTKERLDAQANKQKETQP